MTEEKCKEILSFCQKIIQGSQRLTEKKRKVVLLNEVIHFTAKTIAEDSDGPRKNFKNLRDLVSALCEFHFQGQFLIPNSWEIFGKIFTLRFA